MFGEYAAKPVRRILDLGCGTGNHAIRLAADGYDVVGVDLSRDMLRIAEQKAQERGVSLRWHQADIRDLSLGERFDAVLMMFAVLGYQLENADVLGALRTARRHLTDGGLLAFDIWHGPAVLSQRPGVRVVETDRPRFPRISSGELDILRHRCNIRIRVWQVRNDQILGESVEDHAVRYFFPKELELFLGVSDFRLVRLSAFENFERDPDETSWNAMAVAVAAYPPGLGT